MGKSRTKDQSYVRAKEHSDGLGGVTSAAVDGPKGQFQLLPFNYCALTFLEIDDGVFVDNGLCFERAPLMKYIQETHKNPIDGTELDEAKVYPLRFRKNEGGNCFCPVSEKEFTDRSHIVAIRTTGNTYAYDIVQTLNVKTKDFNDLLFGTPFKRSDIVVLQDPTTMWEKRNTATFFHTKSTQAKQAHLQILKKKAEDISTTTVTAANLWDLDPADPEYARDMRARKAIARDVENNLKFAAAGVTSTGVTQYATDVKKTVSAAEAVEERVFADFRALCPPGSDRKHDAVVALQTSLGEMTLNLFCGVCPKTAYNFLKLAERKYYDETVFHRVVKGFVLQGGDPEGTGSGGESCWGGVFGDEIFGRLRHSKRGVLSMANSGRDSNGSQFFLTLGAAPALDGKHTVFGEVSSGLEVLDAVDRIETDAATERPLQPISLHRVEVLSSPFAALEEAAAEELDPEKKAAREAEREKQTAAGNVRGKWFSAPQAQLENSASTEVGKYMQVAGDVEKKTKKDKKEKKEKKRKREEEEAGDGDAAEQQRVQQLRARLAGGAKKKPGGWDFSGW